MTPAQGVFLTALGILVFLACWAIGEHCRIAGRPLWHGVLVALGLAVVFLGLVWLGLPRGAVLW